MDTQNLSAFIEVANSHSFSIAAEKLFLTQPAISKRIAALEQQVGKKLFDRIGRTVTLTEAGKILLPRAQCIMQEVKETRQQLADMSGTVGGSLQLATSHHIGLHKLPPLLRRFKQKYADVNLQLSFIDSEKAYEAIAHGHIELAVITLPENIPGNIRAQSIWSDPLEFVVSPEHPLAKQSKVQLQDFVRFPAILPEYSTITTQIVGKLFEERSLNLQVHMATNFLETIKMMVSVNLGWSVLPTSMIDKQLKPIKLPSISLTRQLGYVHHKDRSLSNAARAFIAIIAD
jgi:DNA-binding transcriptional LysR family regulator